MIETSKNAKTLKKQQELQTLFEPCLKTKIETFNLPRQLLTYIEIVFR